LFKLHPQFDEPLAAILRTDTQAQIVLIQGRHSYWTYLLQQRFQQTMPDVSDRILFLPPQNETDFLALLKCCDVLLDPFPFGGGATTYDAISVGTPTVTLPGEFMRGRVTAACWRQIELNECIASGPQDYVDRAIRIALDRQYRAELSRKIVSNKSTFFENRAAVEEKRHWILERLHTS
jgi:predicted O-linked N-acetylglucosamine transferase (SPINDLY family)